MKKYRVREKSLLWHLLRAKKPLQIIGMSIAFLLIFTAMSAAAADDLQTYELQRGQAQSEEDVKLAEKVAENGTQKPETALTQEERYVVECIVQGEAGGESYKGKMLVTQCIKNACEKDNLKPSQVMKKYKYSGWNENLTEETKNAVSAVFDNGEAVTEEYILYFYAPKYCDSTWHETQKYVLTEGGHRFFAEY